MLARSEHGLAHGSCYSCKLQDIDPAVLSPWSPDSFVSKESFTFLAEREKLLFSAPFSHTLIESASSAVDVMNQAKYLIQNCVRSKYGYQKDLP